MRNQLLKVTAFILVLSGVAWAAGSWSINNFGYKPQLTTQGTTDKAQVDISQDRIDAKLGAIVMVGDPAYPTFAAAIVTLNTAGTSVTLRVPTGTHTVSGDLTINSNINIRPDNGAVFAIATGKTLTINGTLEAGPYQIFSPTNTGKVIFAGNIPKVKPEWFGAVRGADSTTAIKKALESLGSSGGIIDFEDGTYTVTPGEIVIAAPGLILQGRASAMSSTGSLYGTVLKSATGTGKLIAFQGASTSAPVDSCQINDMILWGNDNAVQGLSLKWVSNFRSRNVLALKCLDDGIYMEQVWDSSFYDLEVEWCGAQATSKAGLHIYNGADDNSNNLRFFSFHAENNYGDDVWIDATGAGTGGNYNIAFMGGKTEKNTGVGDYSTKAFHISGWDGATGNPNNNITIQNYGIIQFYEAGDIGVHFEGSGYMAVDNCFISNTTDGGTGIKVAGPVVGVGTHRLTGNRFQNVADEITIDSTCPRNQVWAYNNANVMWNETDNRIHINGTSTGMEVVNVHPPGLKVFNNAVSPDTKIDISASSAWLEYANFPLFVNAPAYTINTANVGVVNGTRAALAANTWYYFYIISNGTTTGGWCDTSATAPALPSGYTFKKLIGAMVTDAASHFLLFNQVHKKVRFAAEILVLNDGSYAAYTEVDLSSCVPPNIASEVLLDLLMNATGAAQSFFSYDGVNNFFIQYNYAGQYNSCQLAIPIVTSQKIYFYKSGTVAQDILVQGFELLGQ